MPTPQLSIASTVPDEASQRELAYRKIRAEIVAGNISTEALITEKQLASRIGMGRTPVREAIQDLARDEYLRVIPYRGILVNPFTLTDLQELYELRLAIEPVAAALAAERATAEEILHMQAIIQKSSRHSNRDAVEREPDIHLLIVRAARNKRIASVFEGVRHATDRARRFGISPSRAFSRDAVGHHREVVDAIRNRDPEAAEQTMRKHILAGLNQRLTLVELTKQKRSLG